MQEKVVADNFNIYDVFVRFGPGCILVGFFYYCCSLLFHNSINIEFYMKLLIYISLSYIAGCLIRALVRPIFKFYNRKYFGGQPRNIYLSGNLGKAKVLKHEVTRNLAERVKKNVVTRLNLYNFSEMEINHFVFGYMINRLVIDGHSNKSDRINSLSEMCSSFAVTIILCDLIGIFTLAGLAQMGKCPTNVIEIIAVGLLLSLVGEVSSCYLYSHYVQMRFTIVVKQFVVSNEWAVAVEK